MHMIGCKNKRRKRRRQSRWN